MQTTWPVRTREHVDLWLHAYAMLATDSTLIPYFRRGYRDQMIALRRQRGVAGAKLIEERHERGPQLADSAIVDVVHERT